MNSCCTCCCDCDCHEKAAARDLRTERRGEVGQWLDALGATRTNAGFYRQKTWHWHHPNWHATLKVTQYGIQPCVDLAKKVLRYEDITRASFEVAVALLTRPLPTDASLPWWERFTHLTEETP